MSVHRTRLGERVIDQTLACIGCNDCLLACPLTEGRAVTIAELNAATAATSLEAKNVVDFVVACTQCRQCVPVCPADLSRADMILFNKMKVEDAVPDYELYLQARSVTIPSGWTLDGLSGDLVKLAVFAGVLPTELRRLLLASTLRLVFPGDTLAEEGGFHEKLSVVLSGSVEQASRGSRGEHIPILNLGPGSFFGEMGVLTDAPEPFSVRALEQSIVLEAPKAAVLRLGEMASAFADVLDRIYRERAVYSYAARPGALGALGEAAVRMLLEAASLVLLSSGETLFGEGDPPSDLFLVKSGFVRAMRGSGATSSVLVYFREGDLFGQVSLMAGQPQAYSVQAASRTELIRIPSASLQRLFVEQPQARDAIWHAGMRAEELARSTDVGTGFAFGSQSGPASGRLDVQSFVESGLATGREVLVVDETRCTHCRNCIAACERRHGHARLELEGQRMGNYLFPTACRHCEDPVCLMCSVNGIVRLPTGQIQIVEDNCIGCGACAERCPYGNIRMHPVDPPDRGLFFSLWDLLVGSSRRAESLADLDPKAARLAVKCDLCAGHGDYACVTACPVGAAFRIDPQTGSAARKAT